MRNGKTISVVIPTLNEEKNIGFILSHLPNYIDEIIVVDGYSKDNTVKIVKEYDTIILFDNYGKGSALIEGAKNSKGDYIVMMDADLSHRIKEIDLLITGLDIGYDVCMGSRFMQGGGSSDITFLRYIGNKFFVNLVNLLFRMNYSDLCYGYRAIKNEAFQKMKLGCKGFAIETEISIKAAKTKLKVIEIPSFEKKENSGLGN